MKPEGLLAVFTRARTNTKQCISQQERFLKTKTETIFIQIEECRSVQYVAYGSKRHRTNEMLTLLPIILHRPNY
jgi:hypothetical protein